MQDRKYSVGVGNRGLMILKRCSEKALRRRYDMREEAKEEGRKPCAQLEEECSGQQRLPVRVSQRDDTLEEEQDDCWHV